MDLYSFICYAIFCNFALHLQPLRKFNQIKSLSIFEGKNKICSLEYLNAQVAELVDAHG